ncbi:MAG: hypothetical protein ABSA77_09400, partial [Thermoguttaceae bacterium]
MYALQLLKIAKARNIMTDQEPSDQLRLVVSGDSDSAARSNERHDDENEGDIDMAAADKRLHSLHREGRTSPKFLRLQEDSETTPGSQTMHSLRFTEQFKGLFSLAVQMTAMAG